MAAALKACLSSLGLADSFDAVVGAGHSNIKSLKNLTEQQRGDLLKNIGVKSFGIRRKFASHSLFSTGSEKLFSDCIFSILASSKTSRSKLFKALTSHGATVQDRVTRKTSYLICSEDSVDPSQSKVATAEKFEIPIATVEFMTDCFKSKSIIDIESDDRYLVSTVHDSLDEEESEPASDSPLSDDDRDDDDDVEVNDDDEPSGDDDDDDDDLDVSDYDERNDSVRKTPKSGSKKQISLYSQDSNADVFNFGDFSDDEKDDMADFPSASTGDSPPKSKNSRKVAKRQKTKRKHRVFEGHSFRLNISGKSGSKVKDLITSNGGKIRVLKSKCDYAVFPRREIERNTGKVEEYRSQNISVLSVEDITKAIKTGSLPIPKKVVGFTIKPKKQTKPFEGFRFAIDGKLSLDQKTIKSMIIENGGILRNSITNDLTHLLSTPTNVQSETRTKKVSDAIEQSVIIVSVDFVARCSARHELLEPKRWILFKYDEAIQSDDDVGPSIKLRLERTKNEKTNFCELIVDESSFFSRSGLVGKNPRQQKHEYRTYKRALQEFEKVKSRKVKAGFVEVPFEGIPNETVDDDPMDLDDSQQSASENASPASEEASPAVAAAEVTEPEVTEPEAAKPEATGAESEHNNDPESKSVPMEPEPTAKSESKQEPKPEPEPEPEPEPMELEPSEPKVDSEVDKEDSKAPISKSKKRKIPTKAVNSPKRKAKTTTVTAKIQSPSPKRPKSTFFSKRRSTRLSDERKDPEDVPETENMSDTEAAKSSPKKRKYSKEEIGLRCRIDGSEIRDYLAGDYSAGNGSDESDDGETPAEAELPNGDADDESNPKDYRSVVFEKKTGHGIKRYQITQSGITIETIYSVSGRNSKEKRVSTECDSLADSRQLFDSTFEEKVGKDYEINRSESQNIDN